MWHKTAWVLLLIGGFNWLLVGLFGKDLFHFLGMGFVDLLPRVVYVLVGVSAIAFLGVGKCCLTDGKMCKCTSMDCSHCGVNGNKMTPPPAA